MKQLILLTNQLINAIILTDDRRSALMMMVGAYMFGGAFLVLTFLMVVGNRDFKKRGLSEEISALSQQ